MENEFKGTKGKWENSGSNVYVDCKLMFTCWSESAGHLDDRLEGESWLGMRKRTEVERNLLTKIIPQHNALLISKAPEMLEMLKELLNNSDVPNEIYDKAKQLIKEATTI